MKKILKEGKISILLPDGEGGALSGEVHLIEHKDKKYVVRICSDIIKAKYYEEISKKLEKKKIIPKFLGRHKNNVFYEYIEGRDLKQNEKLDIFEQLGEIGAQVNKLKTNVNPEREFYDLLKQLSTGKFKPSVKVINRRKRSKIRKKPKKVFSKKDAVKIKELYKLLKNKTKANISLDISDFIPGNFRLRKGKVILVDIESIKPAIKGKGIAKGFQNYIKSKKRQEKFIKGYNKISSSKFISESYKDLYQLLFAVQASHFKTQVARNYDEDVKKIFDLINKYCGGEKL
jgi:Choline/ethanolamine kinase